MIDVGDTTQIINAALNTTTKTIIDDSSIDISDMLKILGDKLDSLAFKDIGAIVEIVKRILREAQGKINKGAKSQDNAKIFEKACSECIRKLTATNIMKKLMV